MKKLKVSIQDEHTLVLQEAGEKGDIIDLKSIHETDIDATTVNLFRMNTHSCCKRQARRVILLT